MDVDVDVDVDVGECVRRRAARFEKKYTRAYKRRDKDFMSEKAQCEKHNKHHYTHLSLSLPWA